MKKQQYFKYISRIHHTPHHYYTRVRSEIDPVILPLVKVLNNSVTVSLFSSEGHFKDRSEPYVMFAILPGRKREWNRILRLFLHIVYMGRSVHYAAIYHRFHPKMVGTEDKKPHRPFIDWSLNIRIPDVAFKSGRSYSKWRNQRVEGATGLFRDIVRWVL